MSKKKFHIIFADQNGNQTLFRIWSGHLWAEMFHRIAFLTESGRDVSYIKTIGKENKEAANIYQELSK